MGTTGEKKKTSEKNVDGRSTSSHDNKKFRNRSMEKQRGMAFGFWKTARAVIKLDGWMDGWMDGVHRYLKIYHTFKGFITCVCIL